jgi:hypothetical protein
MTKKVAIIGVVAALALTANLPEAQAFVPVSLVQKTTSSMPLFAEEPEAAFKPAEPEAAVDKEEIGLEVAEMLGRGSAKVCR